MISTVGSKHGPQRSTHDKGGCTMMYALPPEKSYEMKSNEACSMLQPNYFATSLPKHAKIISHDVRTPFSPYGLWEPSIVIFSSATCGNKISRPPATNASPKPPSNACPTHALEAEQRNTFLRWDLGACLPVSHGATGVDWPGHAHGILAVHVIQIKPKRPSWYSTSSDLFDFSRAFRWSKNKPLSRDASPCVSLSLLFCRLSNITGVFLPSGIIPGGGILPGLLHLLCVFSFTLTLQTSQNPRR